ncbi:hypothetical protein RhiirA4_478295 [Rhizophagus irregularis]|uniref:Uncharacterized protein n=1 Tax=Rhizophagus irregularis TaxID=588596 RepID=A0A2I1HEQ8_9GLOM|nr:hypothetical protein RhiirA4_478295 [Rhizophagus irregularis]
MIELNDDELNCEQENSQKVSDGFIEDQRDARFITLQAMIDEVGQDDVLEIWKVVDIRNERKNHDIYQDENLQESIIFNNRESTRDNEFIDKNILPIRKAATIPTTVPILKKTVHKRNLYGHYIRRKSNQNTPETSPALDERPTIDERPAVDATDEISSNPQEKQINDSDTNFILDRSQIEEDETEKEREINDINLQTVKNLNRVITKGRPPKQRYLSSVEKKQGVQGRPKTRGSYKCHVCNGIGHNAAFHKNAGNKYSAVEYAVRGPPLTYNKGHHRKLALY